MNAAELERIKFLWTSSGKAGRAPPREKFHLPGQHDQQAHAGGLTPVDETPEITDAKLNAAVKDVSSWPNPAARRIGQAALRRYELSRDADAELMIHRNGDRAVGVMTLGDSADLLTESGVSTDLAREDYLEVEYLASGEKGAGSKLLESAFERAAETGRGIVLYSLDGAVKFYQALGGTPVPGAYNIFHWPPKVVKSMIKAGGN